MTTTEQMIVFASFNDGVIVRYEEAEPVEGTLPFVVVPASYEERVIEALQELSDDDVIDEDEEKVTVRAMIPSVSREKDKDMEAKQEAAIRTLAFGQLIGLALDDIYGDVPDEAMFGKAALTWHMSRVADPDTDTIH